MSTEVITLRPTGEAELAISGAIELGMEPDWGEQAITTSLATGPDVIGGVAGTRTRGPVSSELPLQISASTGSAYMAAVGSLNDTVYQLAAKGGTIARQVVFSDGTTTEELETEILECALDPDEGWMQAHRTFSNVSLHLTRQPMWLADEELIATVGSVATSSSEIAIGTAARGNLPGPGRLVVSDLASTARRFVEIGGAFDQDIGSTAYEFRASTFSLTGADGTLGGVGSDTAAIGGRSISVSSLAPIWRVVGYQNSLPYQGSFRVRIRAMGGTDDATALMRVSWQAGSGDWEEVGTVSLNQSYYDIDVGTISNYTEAETINIKVECSATDTDTTGSQKLDTMTVFPAELYAIARGVPITGATSGVAVFDDFAHNFGSALGTIAAPIAPAGAAGTWVESGDATPDWTIGLWTNTPNVTRAITTADADVNSGQYQTIGNTTMTDTTVSVDSIAIGNTSSTKNDETRGGIIARYVDTNNWLGLFLRNKKQASGRLHEMALYKRVAGVVTKLYGFDWDVLPNDLRFTLLITSAGVATVTAHAGTTGELSQVLSADADLAGTGALNDGKVGIYAAANHTHGASVTVTNFSATANAPTVTNVDVVRSGGKGEMSSEGAWSTASDGSVPVPVSVYQGSRIWIPPKVGRLMVKARSSDSETEADTGYSTATSYALYTRPAFSTISDST